MMKRRSNAPKVRSSLGFVLAASGLIAWPGVRAANAATITVDASKQTAGNPHFWSAAFGTGKAKLALRGDWQTHYKLGNRELGAQRVRGHGLLNSDGSEMELWKGAGSYDWKNLDTYLLAITSAGMRPVIELDFMPKALGSSSSDPMHSPPKDYNEWNNFIKALTQHMVDKYGMDEVSKWYFEVWNEPDYPGFWVNTDMDAYYKLYDNTVDALTSVIPNVLVGGPSTTQAGPIKAFLQHCKSANKRVNFVSSHVYPGGSNTGTSADAKGLVDDNTSRISGITGAGYSTADVLSFNTEWNSSYSGQGGNAGDATLSMDNHWNVGFILKGIKLLSDKNSGDTPAVEIFSYWALTDVFDEDGGTDGIHMTSKNNGNMPFDGVFGLMTFQGVRKAGWNAFKLLNYLGPKRLSSGGGTGNDGIDAMATTSASGDSLQILVYNYYKTLNTASGSGESVTINVSNLPSALANKKVFVTQFLVDETHSNPYSVWAGQSKPGSPSEAQWREMRAAQHLALYPDTKVGATQDVTTSFSTTFSLKKQAGTLIIVSTKRPVTGRDALVEIEGEDYDGQDKATKEDSGDSALGQSISLASGGYVYFENVDYTDDGVGSVQLRVKSGAEATLELHQDTQTGTLLGSCKVTSTSNAWATQTCTLAQKVTGVSKLYVVASAAIRLNWLKFQAGGDTPGTGGSGGGGSGSGGVIGRGGAGGTPSSSGGTAGSGGGSTAKGGSGGNASGGSGGKASGGSGGDPSGGSGGDDPSGGSGGDPSGGSGGSAKGGSGGNASGGSGGNASGGSGGSSSDPTAASGCTCSVDQATPGLGSLLLIAGFVLALRRRRARRCS